MEINVEYCGTCGYVNKYNELSKAILEKFPEATVAGQEGRRASFEVTLNGTIIHSKLNTMAFPDYDDVTTIIGEVQNGKDIRTVKRQPITDCLIL